MDISVQLSPCRVLIEISDLSAGRAWALENFLFDLRSAGSAEAVAFPADKKWTSNCFEEYRGALKLARSTMEKPLLEVTVDFALSWFPAHAAISWSEPQSTFVRITTRSPPHTGHWAEIPFDDDLYKNYEPRPFNQRKRFYTGSWDEWNAWYDDDRKKEENQSATTPIDRQTSSDHASQTSTAVLDRAEHVIADPNETPPTWLCDQGCFRIDDPVEDDDQPKPVSLERLRPLCKKNTNLIKLVLTQQDLDTASREVTGVRSVWSRKCSG